MMSNEFYNESAQYLAKEQNVNGGVQGRFNPVKVEPHYITYNGQAIWTGVTSELTQYDIDEIVNDYLGHMQQGKPESEPKVNLPAPYLESIATLHADGGRDDVKKQVERHMARGPGGKSADVEAFVKRLQSHKPILNRVLVLTYFKDEVIRFEGGGGIIKPTQTLKEDEYQGKVGLVVAMGPRAFEDTEDGFFLGVKAKVGDYVLFRHSDGVRFSVGKAHCRLIEDKYILSVTTDPESVDLAY